MAEGGGAPAQAKPEYSSVTIEGKCPECPDPKKKKPKKKGKPPILEVAMGVFLFVFLIMSTSSKIKNEKLAAEQGEYLNEMEISKDKPRVPKEVKRESRPQPKQASKYDLSNFSDLERQYIQESCKGKTGNLKEKCIQKSINELLDLY